MMKYRVGDKVKFLNEKGGGVVSKIISPNMVNVAIEDGFDIPVLTKDIIKVEMESSGSNSSRMFKEDFNVSIKTPVQEETAIEQSISPIQNNSSRGDLPQGVYLSFTPIEQKWLITGDIDIHLVNQTPYDILYSVILKKEKDAFSGFDYGSVPPFSKVHVETSQREDIEKWCSGTVQMLFHSESSAFVIQPVSAEYRIRAVKFMQEGSFQNHPFFESKANIISLIHLSRLHKTTGEQMSLKDIEMENPVVNAEEVKPPAPIDKHRTGPHEAVVDLHIEEIITDHHKMSNGEMLEVQLSYMVKCLESAIINNYYKVIFIHGVGTGVLRKNINEVLKSYEGISFSDASMQEFGYGATEVIIRRNPLG